MSLLSHGTDKWLGWHRKAFWFWTYKPGCQCSIHLFEWLTHWSFWPLTRASVLSARSITAISKAVRNYNGVRSCQSVQNSCNHDAQVKSIKKTMKLVYNNFLLIIKLLFKSAKTKIAFSQNSCRTGQWNQVIWVPEMLNFHLPQSKLFRIWVGL